MVMTPETDAPRARRFKMRLNYDEYFADAGGHRGRYTAGDVLIVDEDTAERWYSNGVAEPAPLDALTVGEMRQRDRKAEFLAKSQALPEGGAFDQSVTRGTPTGERGLMPPPMPVPPRRARRADLASAALPEDGA